jgi:hypothetical protein
MHSIVYSQVDELLAYGVVVAIYNGQVWLLSSIYL